MTTLHPNEESSRALEGRRFTVRGVVQGVGFRPFVYRLAQESRLAGRVWNDASGVKVEAFGPPAALDRFQERLRSERPAAASIASLQVEPIPTRSDRTFEIVASEVGAERRISLPPDLATCADCARELGDPSDRRHGYPFTNCTNCGPRYTITHAVPYDRPSTTMAGFPMCPDCAREYADPRDRRFHAQPNACPACGPRVQVRTAAGGPVEAPDPIAHVAAALRAGAIAAVKGLGGYHLACDALSSVAVTALRLRKRRDQKAFAVMVSDLEAARRLADLDETEARLLCSVERPIVLCRRRADTPLAPEVAPGSALVGLMLAYSPLHLLLLEAVGRPLVMTSGNLSDEPIAFEDGDAASRLRGVADLFLVHDRPIASRCDDSVARVVAGAPLLLRRSRGYVPRPVRLARRLSRPVLAVGAQLKNAFCLARGDEATLGPHVGDLDNLETYAAYEAAVAHFEDLLAMRPEVLACDLHPLYLSTRYARQRSAELGVPLVQVQHHHAHAAAAMAEHGLEGPVLALAWDGTGLGSDGTAWGGELLLVEQGRFERIATFRPVALPGGDRAIREPWRIALAALRDAYGENHVPALPLFEAVSPVERGLVRRLLASELNCPPAHGAGRAFDCAGALALGLPRSPYEGQVALALENAADPSETGRYPFDVREGPVEQLDLRPLWRALVADLREGRPAPIVAARFHGALAAGAVELVRRAVRSRGRMPVVLTGGCFQNSRLASEVRAGLSRELAVHLHREVPAGDGGLALGQALVADAVVSS